MKHASYESIFHGVNTFHLKTNIITIVHLGEKKQYFPYI